MSLPSGYLQLEYIESTGTQWINSGVIGQGHNKIKINCKIMPISNGGGDKYVFGAGHNGNTLNLTCYQGRLYTGSNNFSLASSTLLDNTLYEIKAKNENGAVSIINNEIVYTGNSDTVFCPYPIAIFGISNSATTVYSSQLSSSRIFNFSIYIDDVLVRDFIPAKRKSDNVVGLYDLTNDIFYTNAGSGTFSHGGVIGAPENIILNDNPLEFTVGNDLELQANFEIRWQISLNYNSVFGSASYEWQDENVILTANVKSGAVFNGWYRNGTLLSTSNPYIITPTEDMTIDVDMDYQYTYNLNYDSSLGNAIITRDSTDLNDLTLTATNNTNAQFKGWYVNSVLISNNLTTTYTLNANVNIEARFDEVYNVTTNVNGNGAISYTRGTDKNDVTFTVIPDEHHHFVKYVVYGVYIQQQNAITQNDNFIVTQNDDYLMFQVIVPTDTTTTPLSLHIVRDITVIAYFEEDEKFRVTASTNIDGLGVYVSNEYDYGGYSSTLWARPFPDYNFVRWEDGTTENPRTITVTDNVTVVAIYQRISDTNGIYQYRCFIKDQLDMNATPKAFMKVDTFNIRTDLMTKSTSTIRVYEMTSNVNEGDVVVLYDPKGTFLYNGVINSIEDNIMNCSQMQSFFKGTWIYNTYPQTYLEGELAYLLGQYIQGKIYRSTYTDNLVATRLGGFTIDFVGSTSANLPTDLDEDGNEKLTIKDMEEFMYDCYANYGIMFRFEINISGANYVHIIVPTYQSIKVGNNMFAIQDMTPITEIEETNRLIIFSADKTYRTTYVATTNGIVENPTSLANRFNITNTNVVFSDDDVADLVANNLPTTMFNHKIEFSLIIKNFIYEFGDFNLGGGLEVYNNDDYFNTVLTGYEISKDSNTNIVSVYFVCGKVRTSLTKLLTRKAIL